MSAEALANRFLVGEESKAAFAGVAAHSSLRLDAPGSASIALALCISAHGVGWPIPKGGAQSVADSLAKLFLDGGGELISDCPVRSLADLPDYRSLFLDITPRQFIKIAEAQLPDRYKKRLQSYRYGPASFKMDWALSAPMPWGSAEFFKAPTVHLAGTLEDIAESERSVWKGSLSPKPYILLAQPTLFDPSRAPEGAHVAWAYCHVPYASDIDASEQIESQIERFAPGFKKNILARSILTPSLMEKKNENLVGGDINGGTLALSQLLTRPIPQLIPYKTPLPNVYLCSSSTPPGSGVHGMCGYYAAWCALH
jgi:phytoene dehydrogenase-like protein